MFCGNCGNKLSGEGKFCSSCGNPADREEQQQQSAYIEADNKERKAKTRTISMPNLKSKFSIIVLAIVIVFAIGIMAKDLIVYSAAPKLYIQSALNKTTKNISKDLSKMQSLLFGNMEQSTNSTSNVKFLINNIEHSNDWTNEDLYMLNGMGIDFTTAVDNNKKELFFYGKYNLAGEELISINGKLDDNEFILNIPELLDQSLAVSSKRFGRDFNSSVFGRNMGTGINDSLDISFSNLKNTSTLEKADEKTKKGYTNGVKTMLENANYQKNGSQSLSIGGKDKKCNRTTITLDSRYVKDGLLELIETMKYDNRIEEWKKTMESANQEYIVIEFEEALDEMKYEITEDFGIDHIKIDVLTHNGNVVKFEFEIIPDKNYKDENLIATLEFLGNKSSIDDIRFTLNVADGDEKLVFESRGNHLGNGNLFTDDTNLTVISYGEEIVRFKSSAEIQLNKKNNNLTANIDLISEDINIKINTRGDYNSSAKLIEYNFADTNLTFKDYYGEALKLGFSAAISKEEGVRKTFDIKKEDKINLFDIDENQLYELTESIAENAQWIERRIEEHMGY